VNILKTGDLIRVSIMPTTYEHPLGGLENKISNATGIVLSLKNKKPGDGLDDVYIPVFVVNRSCFIHRSRLVKIPTI